MDTGTEVSIEERNEQIQAAIRGNQAPAPAAVTEPVAADPVEETQVTEPAKAEPTIAPIKELFPGYSKLSPEDREAADKWYREEKRKQDELKSLAGKVPSTQREAAALKKEVEANRKRLAELERGLTTQGQKDRLEVWEKFRELAPDDAAAVEQRMSPLEKQIVAMQKQMDEKIAQLDRTYNERIQRFEAREYEQELDTKKQSILEIHSDYDDIAPLVDQYDEKGQYKGKFLDPESDFYKWVASDNELRDMFASPSPRKHIALMDLYKREAGISTTPTTPVVAPVNPKAAAVAQRNTQLRQTTDPKPTGAPPARVPGSGTPQDIEAVNERIAAAIKQRK